MLINMTLLIKTYQDAIRQAKNVLTALGIEFFAVYLQECTYYGDVIATFGEHDRPEIDAHPGDHIKVQQCLCDLGSIDNDLRSSEFIDKLLNFTFTITERDLN